MTPAQTFHLTANHDGQSLASALRQLQPERSWSQVRKLIANRRVQVNGNLCLDEGRRVKAGDVVKLLDRAASKPVSDEDIRLVHVDEHLVVVQKPAGITTLRHREETDLPQRRKQLQPTLDELLPLALSKYLGIKAPHDANTPGSPKRKRGSNVPRGKPKPDSRLRAYAVHRLDRDTSGLMVFARTRDAEQKLIRMFARHEVQRAYVAVVLGRAEQQTIDTWLVRDRGDGLRGSTPLGGEAEGAQRAITHIRPLEHLQQYTILECRLETGRTHQIRIHLSEIGHMLCGEKTYTHRVGEKPRPDASGAPRQALHAAELAFVHPFSGQAMRFRMPLPKDLKQWLLKLRQQASS